MLKLDKTGGVVNDVYGMYNPSNENGIHCDWIPTPIDVIKDGKQFVLTIEVPGVKIDDIKIILEFGILNISGEKLLDAEGLLNSVFTDNYIRNERSYGRFYRIFPIGNNYKINNIDLKDGILTIKIKAKGEYE